MDTVRIVVGGVDDLDRLEPLWVAVHEHHRASMPHLEPYVADDVSWRERVALYRSLFERHAPCLLLAESPDGLVGYGLAYAQPASDTWLADTWQTGDLIGEIESLAVRPDHRGQGIGGELLRRLDSYLADAGVRDVVLGVLPGNAAAIRLYERHGFTPTWLYLSRLRGR